MVGMILCLRFPPFFNQLVEINMVEVVADVCVGWVDCKCLVTDDLVT